MKSKCLSIIRRRIPALGLALGIVSLPWVPVNGQNFVRNPDFEEPLGPDNWTIVYVNCGPSDFFIKGRVRMAHKDLVPGTWDGDPYYWSKFGLDFKAGHDWLMHAYASQILTNLTPNANYVISAWMAFYEIDQPQKVQVWMEVLGGPTGGISKVTPYVTEVVLNNPAGWQKFSITHSASPSGRLELRLHYSKIGATTSEKWRNMDAFYDHVSVIPIGQTEYQPPYQILSLSRTGQDMTLTWESVMNNTYRLEVSPNLSDPNAWSLVQWDPYYDPNLFATGSTLTFTTNVAAMLSYNPALPVNGPLYFRVRGASFQP